MMDQATLDRIVATGAVGIVRASDACNLTAIVEALWRGGLDVIEITATTPGVDDAIRRVAAELPGVVIGAGTVLDPETADRVLRAGARFLVSPTASRAVIDAAHAAGAVAIPGALTPSEIVAAWESGGDLIKVFPAEPLGVEYVRALRGPLPQIPLAPTGGVDGTNAGEYLEAGAAVVCVGGWLVPKEAIAREDYRLMTRRAADLIGVVRRIRERRAR